MAKQETPALSMSSTKKEMMDAYNQLLKQLKEKREADMKPEQKIEEKQAREIIETAEALSVDAIAREIGNLKSEIGAILVGISDKLEEEARKYVHLKKAVEAKERELLEIREIERSGASLEASRAETARVRMGCRRAKREAARGDRENPGDVGGGKGRT